MTPQKGSTLLRPTLRRCRRREVNACTLKGHSLNTRVHLLPPSLQMKGECDAPERSTLLNPAFRHCRRKIGATEIIASSLCGRKRRSLSWLCRSWGRQDQASPDAPQLGGSERRHAGRRACGSASGVACSAARGIGRGRGPPASPRLYALQTSQETPQSLN